MKSNLIKIVSVLTILVLAMSIFAGTRNDSSEIRYNSGSTEGAATQSQAGTQAETHGCREQRTRRAEGHYVRIISGASYDNLVMKTVQEKTNTKLDITSVPGDQLDDKLNVLLASGDSPIFSIAMPTR